MFDFDVVTGPGDLAKPARAAARRDQVPPAAAVPPATTSAKPKADAAVDDAIARRGFE